MNKRIKNFRGLKGPTLEAQMDWIMDNLRYCMRVIRKSENYHHLEKKILKDVKMEDGSWRGTFNLTYYMDRRTKPAYFRKVKGGVQMILNEEEEEET